MLNCSFKRLAIMLFISFKSSAVTSVAMAQETDSRTIKKLTVVTATSAVSDIKEIVYDDLGNKDSYTLVSPHPAKNPKKETHTWSGAFVKNIFKTANMPITKINKDELVTFIANDNYNVEIPLRDALEPDLLIATKRNGEQITWFDGGPQMVFALTDPKLKSLYREDTWWSWYLRAIVVGTPKPILMLKKGDKKISVSLTGTKGLMPKTKMHWPNSPTAKKEGQHPREDFKHTYYLLSDLLVNQFPKDFVAKEKPKSVKLHTLNDRETDVDISTGEYRVIFQMNDKDIPPNLGGPIQLCRVDAERENTIRNCEFYIREITIK